MRRALSALVTLVTLPSLAGCFGVMTTPVPPTQMEREALALRGVVVERPGSESERLEFTEVHDLTWTPTALSFVADVDRGRGADETVTRLVPLTELESVLVRQLDAAKTSAIIGGVIVGAVAVAAFILTGDREAYLGR